VKSCISPDSEYVCSGSEDGVVYMWSVQDGNSLEKEEIDVSVEGPVSCVAWNPVYHMIAVGSTQIKVTQVSETSGRCACSCGTALRVKRSR